MQDRDLYAKLLGLEPPWEVVDVGLLMEDHSVQVFVALRADAPAPCPECSERCSRHDTRTRSWRHLDTMQYKTLLVAEIPRIDCPTHGIRQVTVPWAAPRSRFTALFECLVIEWLQHASIKAVAELLAMTWDQVAGIMERAVDRGLARRKLSVPKVVGVDETSFQKRHEYVTVVCDPVRAVVLFVADGRSAESLSGFFDPLTAAERARIEAVAMDMSGAYLSAVTRALGPHAHERIVFDKYHLASLLGDAVNKVRRDEHKTLLENHDERLKGTRHLFLMNPWNMSRAQAAELTQLKSSNLKVARAWAIKETFMDARSRLAVRRHFANPIWGRAERALKEVLTWMARSRLAPMVRAARTVRRHFAGVINAAASRTRPPRPSTHASSGSRNRPQVFGAGSGSARLSTSISEAWTCTRTRHVLMPTRIPEAPEFLCSHSDAHQGPGHGHQDRDRLLRVLPVDTCDVGQEIVLVRGGLPLVLGNLVEQAVAAPLPDRIPALDPLVGELDHERGLGQRRIAG